MVSKTRSGLTLAAALALAAWLAAPAFARSLPTLLTKLVRLRAWRVRDGRFTRLTIAAREAAGPSSAETLDLNAGEAAWTS